VWLPLLFPSLFPTLLAVMSLEGGYGQMEGIRERPMLFHDAMASVIVCPMSAMCVEMLASVRGRSLDLRRQTHPTLRSEASKDGITI